MQPLSYATIEKRYPNEWVLLGDPEMNGMEVVNGIVLFHHKDKKELTIQGREFISGYSNYRVIFTGELPDIHRIGIMRKLKTT